MDNFICLLNEYFGNSSKVGETLFYVFTPMHEQDRCPFRILARSKKKLSAVIDLVL